jgi:hypothetical protein
VNVLQTQDVQSPPQALFLTCKTSKAASAITIKPREENERKGGGWGAERLFWSDTAGGRRWCGSLVGRAEARGTDMAGWDGVVMHVTTQRLAVVHNYEEKYL